MSHFAKVESGLVTDVVVAEQDFIDTQEGTWVQTSYNTHGNKHYAVGDYDTPDDGLAIRANYAGVGFTYDESNDVFYAPQPYPSWTLNNTTWLWNAPIPEPEDYDTKIYEWDEAAYNMDNQGENSVGWIVQTPDGG
jgi:protease II